MRHRIVVEFESTRFDWADAKHKVQCAMERELDEYADEMDSLCVTYESLCPTSPKGRLCDVGIPNHTGNCRAWLGGQIAEEW